MKVKINENEEEVTLIREALRQNEGYCPCALLKNKDTKCMCRDFRENIPVGEYCHCGLYLKVEE